MKKVMINLLQQRMDKCTTEQFWAVATLTGLNAFAISQREGIHMALPRWGVLVVIGFVSLYGVFYIIHRHQSYYFFGEELAKLVRGENNVPVFLKKEQHPLKGSALSGVVLYVVWVLILAVATFVSYLVPTDVEKCAIVHEALGHFL